MDLNVKVGDVCVGYFGYSMSIYDFFRVTKITDKSISFEKLKKSALVGSDCFRPKVVPTYTFENGNIRFYPDTRTEKFSRRLSTIHYNCVNGTSRFESITLEPMPLEKLRTGYQEDHLD
ncbi:MAG: hypothetical protein HUJ68_07425 [Clostridia bacterium]|nr:hypothetical protein [Clostridia bacterium]